MQQKSVNNFQSLVFVMIIFLSSCKKEGADLHDPIRPVTSTSNKYVSGLFNYEPAPGQLINTNAGDSIGAHSILGNKDGLVSLGGWGGTIILGFDHTVLNNPDTADIMIYGNAFGTFSEPGVIWVMKDENGNGQPDDTWYELKGSEFNKPGYMRNYSVTYTRPDSATGDVHWQDNQGKSGTIIKNTSHTQAYYPEWISGDTYTLIGTLLPNTNIDSSNASFITSTSFPFGYADNTLGGDMVDISNAIDQDGNTIELNGIDFIKIQTGIPFNLGWLGELSTDITGVADISMGLN